MLPGAGPSVSGTAKSMTSTGTFVASKKGSDSVSAARLTLLRTWAATSRPGDRGCRGDALIDDFAQAQLGIVAGDDPPFALLAENLPLEPVELPLQASNLLLQAHDLPGQTGPLGGQIDDLLRAPPGNFRKSQLCHGGHRRHAQ